MNFPLTCSLGRRANSKITSKSLSRQQTEQDINKPNQTISTLQASIIILCERIEGFLD